MQARYSLNNSNWRANAIDNIGRIIGRIGYHTGYERKDVNVTVVNYKVKVPKLVVSLGKVKQNGVALAVAVNRDEYDSYQINVPKYRLASAEDALELNKEAERLNTLKTLYLSNPTEDLLNRIQNSQLRVMKAVNGVTYQNMTNLLTAYNWYEITGGYIKTSFESGQITLEADCFIVDDEGLPMVVDTEKYKEACIWGVLYYAMLGGQAYPYMSIADVKEEFEIWIARAQNEPKMMSIERHQDFTERWSSLSRGIANETLNNI